LDLTGTVVRDLTLAGWFVVLDALVTQRAQRWDISWMFLACFSGPSQRECYGWAKIPTYSFISWAMARCCCFRSS